MFGYVQPLIPELRVRDEELYRAYYCGLCRAMGRYGLAGRAALTYDGAFLAMLLTCARGEEGAFTPHGCALHPVRGKIPAADGTDVLDYCAAMCILLAKYKLKDDGRDGRPLRKCLLPALAPAARKAAKAYPAMERELRAGLKKLSAIEEAKEPDPDAAPLLFGGVMQRLVTACPGIPGDKLPILAELSRAVGGFIYVVDAWDDRAEDKKRASYNIFNLVEERGFTALPDGRFGDAALSSADGSPVMPEREGKAAESDLREMCAAMIDMYINSAALAFDLLDANGLSPVLENVIRLGLGAMADRVLAGRKGKKKEGEA